MNRILARYPGKCATCGARIKPGMVIDHDPRTRKVHCASHDDGRSYTAGPDRFDMLIEDQMAERCGLL